MVNETDSNAPITSKLIFTASTKFLGQELILFCYYQPAIYLPKN